MQSSFRAAIVGAFSNFFKPIIICSQECILILKLDFALTFYALIRFYYCYVLSIIYTILFVALTKLLTTQFSEEVKYISKEIN
jgi:hypothetical protein